MNQPAGSYVVSDGTCDWSFAANCDVSTLRTLKK